MNRRSYLQAVSLVGAGSLAGCSTTTSPTTETPDPATSQSTESPTTSSTETQTASTPQSILVSFSAEVVRQTSKDAPPQLRAQLTNQSSKIVEIGLGPALMFSDDSEPLEWADELVLDPETHVGPWSEPTQSADGCWRFPEDGTRLVQNSIEWHELSPSDSLSDTYSVYTFGNTGSCLPEGVYRFQDDVYLGNEENTLVLTLSIQADADQQLTVNTDETEASAY